MLYKDIWLIAVWLPLRSAGGSTDLLKPMLIGAVVELIVIPWPYDSMVLGSAVCFASQQPFLFDLYPSSS